MRITAFTLVLLLSASALAGPADVQRVNDDGVAIDGYSPVSYFENSAAEMGSVLLPTSSFFRTLPMRCGTVLPVRDHGQSLQ